MKSALSVFVLMCVCAATSQGVTILFDHGASWAGGAAGNQATIDFYVNTFKDVTIIAGDFGDKSLPSVQAAIAAADILVVGRTLWSTPYDATDGDFYSTLTIPVVFHTSYVTRSSRMVYEDGLNAGAVVSGDETTVTAAGAAVFGTAGTFDWYSGDYGFDTLGTGLVGSGDILATIGGCNLVVGWSAGDTDGSGRTQNGDRLLFNIHTNGNTLPDTAAGMQALTDAVAAYTGLVVIPEPATLVLLGLGSLAMLRKRK